MKTLKLINFRLPLLLVVLSLVPILGGLNRLHDMTSSFSISPESFRFHKAPIPITFHILGASLFCCLGAFQFSHYFRARWPCWHRLTGRALVFFGLVCAFSGLWMTLCYQIPKPLQGTALYWVRLLVGCAMSAALILAVITIIQRNIPLHRAWMIRAYALAQGAGTQVLLFLPLIITQGEVTGLLRDVLMITGWGINLIVAEFIIHHLSTNNKSENYHALDSQ
jgi:hypothetical protein